MHMFGRTKLQYPNNNFIISCNKRRQTGRSVTCKRRQKIGQRRRRVKFVAFDSVAAHVARI